MKEKDEKDDKNSPSDSLKELEVKVGDLIVTVVESEYNSVKIIIPPHPAG